MHFSRPLVLVLGLLGVLGLSVVRGQTDGPAARRGGPVPSTVSVRLLLGIGDAKPQSWSGRVRLDMGEVVALEGWRFRQGDRVTGTSSWEAKSRQLPGKKAARKVDPHQAAGAPAPGFAPSGVVVSLKAPEGAAMTVETDRGRFTVRLADLADGATRTYLNGKVEAQRVPTCIPLIEEEHPEDYPAAVADRRGGN